MHPLSCVLVLALALGGLCLGPAPAGADLTVIIGDTREEYVTPVHRPAYHRYHYYPDSQVYFLLEQRTYFWIDGGAWVHGARLPGHIVLDRFVVLDLETDRPYHYHPVHLKRYPPGQYKKWHDDRRGRGRDDRWDDHRGRGRDDHWDDHKGRGRGRGRD